MLSLKAMPRWEPSQPTVQCVECGGVYEYDGCAVSCPGCGTLERATILKAAEVPVHVAPVETGAWKTHTGSLRRRFEVFKRDGYRCQLCGISALEGARLEADHKVALARGGADHFDNLWVLCFECNRGKSAHVL